MGLHQDCEYDCGATDCDAPEAPPRQRVASNDGLACGIPAPVFAAVETLKAKWWEIWLARIFGRKSVATDSGFTVTMHKWRGKIYLTSSVRN